MQNSTKAILILSLAIGLLGALSVYLGTELNQEKEAHQVTQKSLSDYKHAFFSTNSYAFCLGVRNAVYTYRDEVGALPDSFFDKKFQKILNRNGLIEKYMLDGPQILVRRDIPKDKINDNIGSMLMDIQRNDGWWYFKLWSWRDDRATTYDGKELPPNGTWYQFEVKET